MKYKITIVEEESGKKVVDDKHCDVIIGAISSENDMHVVDVTNCNATTLAAVVDGLQRHIEEVRREHKEVDLIINLVNALKNKNKEGECDEY